MIVGIGMLTWCTPKTPTGVDSTGNIVSWTTEIVSGTTEIVSTWWLIESTGSIDSWVVPMASGSEWIHANTGAAAEVKALIDQRNTQPKDEKKINEPDIDLMHQAIEAAKNVGK